jgi:3-methyl-2-oxobutanoate hydroxymethyltransferase
MAANVTIPALLDMKREGRKSVGVVAWDYQIAQIADRAGVDIVSVGDSVGVNLWGHSNPLEVTSTRCSWSAKRCAVASRARS